MEHVNLHFAEGLVGFEWNVRDLFWDSFNFEHAASDGYDRHTRNLSDSSLQVLIVGAHNVALMLDYSIVDAIIGICALVLACQSMKSRILRQSQCQSISCAHLLELAPM